MYLHSTRLKHFGCTEILDVKLASTSPEIIDKLENVDTMLALKYEKRSFIETTAFQLMMTVLKCPKCKDKKSTCTNPESINHTGCPFRAEIFHIFMTFWSNDIDFQSIILVFRIFYLYNKRRNISYS